jgi:hypothetical protein
MGAEPPSSSIGVVDQSAEFLARLCTEFPRFRIVHKRGNALSHAIDLLLRVVTLGRQNRYLTEYHTVIGDTLYVPDSWAHLPALDRVILLRHERIHLLQRRRLGFLGMALLYLVPFFPVGLAYGRARLEWEAYRETLRATAELKGLDALADKALEARIVARFTGPDYGWMWPFPRRVEAWYRAAVGDIEAALRPGRGGPEA